ncbi:cupin domain-containing protein [Candidatus Albibeggiatoa sp. nov. NOAA]|uniref:cupin domain-containing protein n=1 Tax=Candidatus Albibeggiatoa sp. nov. NOAA TaxID=3162724 RepID=UPI0032F92300|nr:cupin domain-containing protein [Thiotrichaceae bacterium]
MYRNQLKWIAASVLIVISSWTVATELLKTQTSWDNGEVEYPEGQLQITSLKLAIKQGEDMPFHCHPVPTMGYVLKGELEVETKQGLKKTFKQGESVVEVMRTLHRGKAIDGDVEVVVFYAGAVSMPNTILETDHESKDYCH